MKIDQKDRIIQDWKNGKTIHQIVQRYTMSPNYIGKIIQSYAKAGYCRPLELEKGASLGNILSKTANQI